MYVGRKTPLAHVLGWLLFAIGAAIFILYVAYQARFLLVGPTIVLTDLPAQTQNNRTITISGVAKTITSITINGRDIATDQIGNFQEPIVLENGYTIVSIVATDRYGRTTTIEKPFVYVAQSRLFNS